MAGVNVIGYGRAESGLGQACRLGAAALQSVGMPFCVINQAHTFSRKRDFTLAECEATRPIYDTNLVYLNAAQLLETHKWRRSFRKTMEGRRNIGYWHWELQEFPDEWTGAFDLLDEVWVPSDFTLRSVSEKAAVPVVEMPHAVSLQVPGHSVLEQLGLPRNRFLFLTMFETLSLGERKNPYAVISAFQRAFRNDDQSVGLIVKMNAPKQKHGEAEAIKQAIRGYENIYLVDEILNRSEVNGLLNETDSYVSLHRSEGFGLPIAEAMYLGKPAIVTNWSGNTDFIESGNSCPVNFRLIRVGEDHGPYGARQVWADPDIEEAAEWMKKLATQATFCRSIGKKAKETMVSRFSPETIGRRMVRRINEIQAK
ncbi:MAG TPA: glycosyltransferase [Bacillales bacterium]|nr:glycosyltransferase [Bacillales bacterium]